LGWILFCVSFCLLALYLAMARRTMLTDLLVAWIGLRLLIVVNQMGLVGILPDISKTGIYLARMSQIVLILLVCSVFLAGVPKEKLLLVALWLLPRVIEAVVAAVIAYWLWVVGRGLLRWARKQ
jgi:hypothetical protein